MSLKAVYQLLPAFVLVFFRLAGMLLAAPLFGSGRVPKRVKLMFALVFAAGLLPSIPVPSQLPDSTWQLTLSILGELLFGLAIGSALSFVFIAVNWAGEIIGQQMGLGLGQVFDPQFGQSGSVVGDLYFMLTLVIFLVIQGHHAFLRGVRDTFDSLPLFTATVDQNLLDLVTGLLQSATSMAMQLAAPILVAMLITDVVLGFLSKTVPQINVMSAGLSLRALLGIVVLIVGLALTSDVISQGIWDSLREIAQAWQVVPQRVSA
ncbi:MAG TPA: flagellar biosynthetic protein FliR [Tepidisphaeraceae bacterium]|nr:flagellar biosynthetic protein FliR [Tepidisphaeraceae bacterium]